MSSRSTLLAVAAVAAVAFIHVDASAAAPTKDECVEAHSTGQDLREKGQLAESKRLFLVCAQQSCPALVQSDCAKFGEELSRTVPSVSFSARDAKGGDVPDTQVFVDDKLVAARLDEGKAYDLDPGKHSVRFSHNGVDIVVPVVATTGEKGRNITATFGQPPGTAVPTTTPETPAATTPPPPAKAPAGPKRSSFPLVVAGVGGAALVTGVVLGIVGLGKVPDACSRSTNQCNAAPGSSAFSDASSGVKLANLGLGIGIAGAVVAVGGLVWYFVSSPKDASPTTARAFTFSF